MRHYHRVTAGLPLGNPELPPGNPELPPGKPGWGRECGLAVARAARGEANGGGDDEGDQGHLGEQEHGPHEPAEHLQKEQTDDDRADHEQRIVGNGEGTGAAAFGKHESQGTKRLRREHRSVGVYADPPEGLRPTVVFMNGRSLVTLIAAGRSLLGVIALLWPSLPARPWVGGTIAASPGGKVLARALGARDLALGVGAWRALRRRRGEASPWVTAGAVADLCDATVTLAAWRHLPRRGRAMVLLAAGGSAATAALAWMIDEHEPGNGK